MQRALQLFRRVRTCKIDAKPIRFYLANFEELNGREFDMFANPKE